MGRVPSSVTSTQLPGTGFAVLAEKIALGLVTPEPPLGHGEDTQSRSPRQNGS